MHAPDFDAQIPREIDAVTGLPIGPEVADAAPAPRPERIVLDGRYCRLEPLDPVRHGDDLFAASTPPDAAARHLYLFEDAPTSRAGFQTWMIEKAASNDPLFFAVIDKATGRACRTPNADAHRSRQSRHRNRQHLLGT